MTGGIVLPYVRSAEDIVYADVIEVSKRTKHLRRYHALTAFVVGICSLRHVYSFADLLLRQIRILSQVAYTLIFLHFITGLSID